VPDVDLAMGQEGQLTPMARFRERLFTIRVEIILSVEQADAARCRHFRSSENYVMFYIS